MNCLSEFKAVWGLIKQRAVQAFTVVKNFDVFKDGESGFISGFEMGLINQFFFKGRPKALDDGIV
jgi:hypothetical protein